MAAKFRSIAVSSIGDDDGGVIDSVYAIDEGGVVWLYSTEDERWEALSTKRYAGPKVEADESDDA